MHVLETGQRDIKPEHEYIFTYTLREKLKKIIGKDLAAASIQAKQISNSTMSLKADMSLFK